MKIKIIIFFVITAVSFSGCVSREAGWKQIEGPSIKGNVSALLKKAESQISKANVKEKVIEIINTYEAVLKIEPLNREALEGAAMHSFLAAYGYSDNREEKEKYYLNELKYTEQIMYTNPDFKNLVDKGESIYDAFRVLTINEMGAMFWWYLAFANIWMECFNGSEKVFTIRWPFKGRKVLERMMEVDPEWWNGTTYYVWAGQYAVLPGILGGDVEKAEESYMKAFKLGPKMFNFRRTKARLLHIKTGNREDFVKDLNWVLSQDPHKGGPSYPFNVFLQRDAKEMLENIDEYF